MSSKKVVGVSLLTFMALFCFYITYHVYLDQTGSGVTKLIMIVGFGSLGAFFSLFILVAIADLMNDDDNDKK